MEPYVGMDVSLEETSICVVDGSGGMVSEGTVISEPAAIAEFIKAKAGSAKRIGLETGPTTTWLGHELRARGLPVICIDARHAKAALSMQIKVPRSPPKRPGQITISTARCPPPPRPPAQSSVRSGQRSRLRRIQRGRSRRWMWKHRATNVVYGKPRGIQIYHFLKKPAAICPAIRRY